MNRQVAARLAWSTFALYVAFIIPTLLLQFVNGPDSFAAGVFNVPLGLAVASVGALIASRRPENPIGWLFCVAILLEAPGEFALEYAVYSLVTQPGSLPGGEWMAWFGAWMRGLGFSLIVTFLFLLFPDGRLPSPRWRAAAWLAAGYMVLSTIVFVLSPTNTDFRLASAHNPLGIEGASEVFNLIGAIYFLSTGIIVAVCGASVLFRFRRAKGEERQQLKWFAYAAVLGMVLIGAIVVGNFLQVTTSYALGTFLFDVAVVGIPISVGIAILRYRLYDIDFIIRRTLIYSVLTGMLALVYFGSVLVLQAVFAAVGGQRSELVIILSTLAIAALFAPLRRRVQDSIDRRFYRRKYDAAKTLAEFGATVRDETDLEKLTAQLIDVVNETMQPESVGLWLKPTATPGRQPATVTPAREAQRGEAGSRSAVAAPPGSAR